MSPKRHQRPFSWSIAGHEAVRGFLEQSVRRGTLTHAYCFAGPKRVGKFTTALAFAQMILCEAGSTIPCGTCASCRRIAKGIHPDCRVIRPDTDEPSLSIDRIRRELVATVQLSPLMHRMKVAIIDDAELMTREAANSVLKTLEEPPASTIIILVCERPEWLPMTVVSRCQTIRFHRLSHEELDAFLRGHLSNSSERDELVHLADGLPGLALEYLHHPEQRQAAQQCVADFLAAIDESSVGRRLSFVEGVTGPHDSHLPTRRVLSLWKSALRDLLLVRLGLGRSMTNRFALKRLSSIAKRSPAHVWSHQLHEVQKAEEQIDRNVQPRAALDTFLLGLP